MDSQEFEKALRLSIPRLLRYARSLVRNNEDRAMDLVQDALERAWTKRHLYKEDTNFRGWLTTILHNEHVNAVRRSIRQNVHVELADDMQPLYGITSPEEYVFHCIELREATLLFNSLSGEHYETLHLAVFEELSYAEIAARLSIPIGTVQSRISRARRALRMLADEVVKVVAR